MCVLAVYSMYALEPAVCVCELQAAWHMSNWCDRPAVVVVRYPYLIHVSYTSRLCVRVRVCARVCVRARARVNPFFHPFCEL
jgi:hypothetical protein